MTEIVQSQDVTARIIAADIKIKLVRGLKDES